MYVIWTVLWEVTWELLWEKKPQTKFVLRSVVSQVTVCDMCVLKGELSERFLWLLTLALALVSLMDLNLTSPMSNLSDVQQGSFSAAGSSEKTW